MFHFDFCYIFFFLETAKFIHNGCVQEAQTKLVDNQYRNTKGTVIAVTPQYPPVKIQQNRIQTRPKNAGNRNRKLQSSKTEKQWGCRMHRSCKKRSKNTTYPSLTTVLTALLHNTPFLYRKRHAFGFQHHW